MHKLLRLSLTLSLAAPMGAMADMADDIRLLRHEIELTRAAYEARLQALEQRLKSAEAGVVTLAARPASAPAPAPAPAPLPAPAPGAVGAVNAAGSAFNPAMSLILSGIYSRSSRDPANYAITGFRLPVGAEVGLGTRGFSLAESELGLSASIDPWWRGAATFALHGDNSVSVEEAFVQTTAMGRGLSLKAGRFLSDIGYLNSQHAHAWDFVDNPLAYQAFLGTQYGDDGVQLTWLAPLDQYLRLGAELGRGRSFPGSDSGRNGAGMTALTLRTGGDIGASHNWRAGLSVLSAKANEQLLQANNAQGQTVSDAFNGRTRVWVIDAVWKWAPQGNATRTNFKLQGEWLRSLRSGSLVADGGTAPDGGATPPLANAATAYRATSSGGYVQAVYQFMPHWRVGLRTERLSPAVSDAGLNTASLGSSRYRPTRQSLMLDFSASEFSRLRLQLTHDRSRQGLPDRQISLQYQMSLGAHAAHAY